MIMMMMVMNWLMEWLTNKRRLALFPAGIIVRDLHLPQSLKRHKQYLNLRQA